MTTVKNEWFVTGGLSEEESLTVGGTPLDIRANSDEVDEIGALKSYSILEDLKLEDATVMAASRELLLALQAQELASQLKKIAPVLGLPAPNDPQYTPFIGEWNGLHAPEQRYWDFQKRRQELRAEAIAKATGHTERNPTDSITP